MRQYGKPDQILTDRGTQFYPARGGRSEFTEFCSGNGIEHIVASVRRPSTIGKIEAFHKAYVCESWMFPNHCFCLPITFGACNPDDNRSR